MPSSGEHQRDLHVNAEVANLATGANFDTVLAAPGDGLAWVVDWLHCVYDGGGASDYTSLQFQVFATGGNPADGKYVHEGLTVAAGVRAKLVMDCPNFPFRENFSVTIRTLCNGAVGAATPVRIMGVARKVARTGTGLAA